MKELLCKISNKCGATFDFLAPAVNLFIRCVILDVFFRAGLLKIQTWDTTVMLFTYEYTVPLLSPHYAALLGTCIELILPVFIVLGLGGRLPIFILFVFNIMAVVSYPYLLTEEGAVGLQNHFFWGVMLATLLAYGTDKLSLDNLMRYIRSRR